MLAGLYMGRSDTQLVVRQASLHVWKIVVSNTPRTLREILPTLFGLLLKFLASTCADKRTVRNGVDKMEFSNPATAGDHELTPEEHGSTFNHL